MKRVYIFSLIFVASFFISANAKSSHLYFDRQVNQYIGCVSKGVAIIENEGFARYEDSKWSFYNQGLSIKNVYPFTNLEYRRLSALGCSSLNSNLVALSDGIDIFVSNDLGENWNCYKRDSSLPRSVYITAIYPHTENLVYIGTSCQGLYEGVIKDGKASFKPFLRFCEFFYMGGGSYEHINTLFIDNSENPKFYFSLGFNKGFYCAPYDINLGTANKITASWSKVAIPFDEDVINISQFEDEISLYTNNYIYYFNLNSGIWNPHFTIKKSKMTQPSPERQKRLALAKDKKGLYVRWDNVSRKAKFDSLIKIVKEAGYNSIVVDLKNDSGQLTYDSKIPFALTLGAVINTIDIKALVSRCKEEGIYLIGRVVVFKDSRLYRYDNNKYAVWDYTKNRPWGNYKASYDKASGTTKYYVSEHWVDPFCQDVWEYNAQIALELQEMGVDEVQFDYIRFPTDGPVKNIKYRYEKENMSRIDALESFLRFAREKVSIPIGTDLYGYQSYFQMGNAIGQSIGMFSYYVDVISPMYYPSHFHRNFIYHSDYSYWAREIYRSGGDRATDLAVGGAIIRPYVQAFLMGEETKMSLAQYKLYFERQIEGVEMSKASGFTLWNNSNNYYMLTD